MTSLNTFGAILTYAIEMETRLRDYYQSIGQTDRAKDAENRRARLERVRRENVVEITLEAIEGLDETDFRFNLDDVSAAGQQAAEETAARFYKAAAPKINVREARSALERCGKQHAAILSG